MITVTISGFKTIEEARGWVDAYEGGVEQDMSNCAEANGGGYAFPFSHESDETDGDNINMVLTHPDTYPKQQS